MDWPWFIVRLRRSIKFVVQSFHAGSDGPMLCCTLCTLSQGSRETTSELAGALRIIWTWATYKIYAVNILIYFRLPTTLFLRLFTKLLLHFDKNKFSPRFHFHATTCATTTLPVSREPAFSLYAALCSHGQMCLTFVLWDIIHKSY